MKPTDLPKEILIPKCLPAALATVSTGVRNAVSTYLALKVINQKGVFGLVESKKKGLKKVVYRVDYKVVSMVSDLCKHSPKTVDNHIQWMISEGLATWDEEENLELRICSYDDFCKHFGLHHSGRSRYRVKPTFRKLSHIIEFIPLTEKKEECKQAFNFKIDRTPGLKAELQNVVGSETYSFTGALWHCQKRSLTTRGLCFDEDENFAIMMNRADFEVNYKTLTAMYGFQSRGSVAYMKRKWQLHGIANVEQREIELPYSLWREKAAREAGQTKYGTIRWSGGIKAVVFRTCDKIEALNWNIDVQPTALKEAEKWRSEVKARLAGGTKQGGGVPPSPQLEKI